MLLHCTALGLDHVPWDCVSPHCPPPLQSHTSPPSEAHGPLRSYETVFKTVKGATCYSRASLKSISSGQGKNLSIFVASTVFTLKNVSQDENLLCEKLLNLSITMVNTLLVCAL